MSTPTTPEARSTGDSPSRTRSVGRGTLIAAGVGAFVLHVLVLFFTVSLGLFWGVWTYFVAVGQTILGFGVIGWLLWRRRPIAVLIVPFASAAITLGLLAITSVIWPERLVP